MTVCLASVCGNLSAIVAVSDTMLSISAGPIDPDEYDAVMAKQGWLSRTWRTLYAGDDLSHLIPLFADIRNGLSQPRDATAHDFRTVAHVCKSVFYDYWRERISDTFFRRMNTTYDDYFAGDYKRFTAREREKVFRYAASFEIPLDLLVYGFGPFWPHIFVVRSPGQVDYHDSQGFWSVGGGVDVQRAMIGHMASHRLTMAPLDVVVTRLCEAKCSVEGINGIGDETMITILFANNEEFLNQADIKSLRNVCKKSPMPLTGKQFDLARECAQSAIESSKFYTVLQQEIAEDRARKLDSTKPPEPPEFP